ncbi:D-cysteine desulfhydrase [Microbacterium sp. MPKO10]|uniref:D-cysteine desulfhydrase n=1 Tax=Microbacterium sp. MPKO10 TaxID=2989818 RepID=UPI0022369FA2|nr:D-cysteine desulfhydrase [Microbacterium sp. MPKO10]MCW4456838.1 D-cysteine desulfhydrase [Microbacterium sp. MPKO10]
MQLSRFPRRYYTSGVTPLQMLPRLSAALGGPTIYVKRDDLLGLVAGGSKTRKLEFLMAEALSLRADTIITAGGVQSNHCRLTLSAATIEGLHKRIVLKEHIPGSYSSTGGGNNLLYRLLEPEQITVVDGNANTDDVMIGIAEEVTAAGGNPYIVPSGGSNALGTLGYARCADEISEQSRALGVSVDHVICASGSGGTQAGLVVGFAEQGSRTAVTGINVSDAHDTQRARVLALARDASSLAGGSYPVTEDMITVRDDFVGAGYSLPTSSMSEALTLFAQLEGVLLDPVYTGKAAAGLVGMIRDGTLRSAKSVVFVHTGGTPALFSYGEAALTG